MYTNFAVRSCLVLLLGAATGDWAHAQPTSSDLARIESELAGLRGDKGRIESLQKIIRDGYGSTGLLAGSFRPDGRFEPYIPSMQLQDTPRQYTPFAQLFIPVNPEIVADAMTSTLYLAKLELASARAALEELATKKRVTAEELAEALLAHERAVRRVEEVERNFARVMADFVRRPAVERRAILEGRAQAARDYAAQLAQINAQIAEREAERVRLLAADENRPVQNGFPRIGAGVLKDERITSKPRLGLFEIKREGARSQLTITFAPQDKLVGTEESLDAVNQTAKYKFDVKLPESRGGARMRGHVNVDFRNNTARAMFEESFDPKTNAWTPIPRDFNAFQPQLMLDWGERTLEDRKVENVRGQLAAEPGKNTAEVSLNIKVRSGAVYTFELKAPATRLCLHVHGSDDVVSVSRFTQAKGKPARVIERSLDEAQKWRIRITGFGANLPAGYELEVWERWPVNGNVPPATWIDQ